MINKSQIQKIVKTKTDEIFPDYKGKIGGGNITHTKKTESGKNIISQTVLSYDVFPISCFLQIENHQIVHHYKNIFKGTEMEEFPPIFTIKYLSKMEITKLEDIDKWIEILKEDLQNKEEIFEKYSNLENLEKLINKKILEHKENEPLSIHEYEIVGGLIASKLSEKVHFQEIYDKYMKHAKQKNYPELVINNVKKTYDYLKNL